MNRSRLGKWMRRVVWGTFAVVLALMVTIGCSPLSTLAFLTPPPLVPPECPLVFTTGPKKNKEEILVALFVTTASNAGPAFAGCEGKIASDLAKKLPELTKETKQKQKLVVLDPKEVNKFKMFNPNWKVMHPSEWGKKLGVDFVLDIHVDKMVLYQPGSTNLLYEGRAEITVDTYDVDAGAGEPKYNYVHPFMYPQTGVLDATNIPINRFKQDYLEHLAADVARKHVSHKPSSGIAEER